MYLTVPNQGKDSGAADNAKKKKRGTEVLSPHGERIRMRLIQDFRLLENLNEMEQGLEAPKYYPSDIMNDEIRSRIVTEAPYALVKFQSIARTTHKISTQQRKWKRIKCRESKYPAVDLWANWVLESTFFQRLMTWVILFNSIVIILETEQETMELSQTAFNVIQVCDFVCLWVYLIELALKCLDEGYDVFRSGWNEFDFIIFLLTLVPTILDMAVPGYTASFSILRTFKVIKICRLLKMVAKFKKSRTIVLAVTKALSALSYIILLLLLFLFMLSLMGQGLFKENIEIHKKMNFTSFQLSKDQKLFNSNCFSNFVWAFSTLFQIFTLDRWSDIYRNLYDVSSLSLIEQVLTFFYFYIWLWLGSFIFKNVFAGIIVNNFQAIQNDERWSEKEKNAQEEMAKFKEEISNELKETNEDFMNPEDCPGDNMSRSNLAFPMVVPDKKSQISCAASKRSVPLMDPEAAMMLNIAQKRSAISMMNSQLQDDTLSSIDLPVESLNTLLQTRWDNLVQQHIDMQNSIPSESIWSRDVLFKFYKTMEELQENVQEQKAIIKLLNVEVLHLHCR